MDTGDNNINSASGDEIERLFKGGGSKSIKKFRAMIQCEHLEKAIIPAQNIMEHLELKGIEKG